MTTNKPNVVAYMSPAFGEVASQQEYAGWEHDAFRNPGTKYGNHSKSQTLEFSEPLIRLTDYESLQSECEKLRKDAARYLWLRAHFGRFSEDYDGGSDKVTKMVVNSDGWDVDPDSLDAAIDAAMQATP